jgi:prepilin-type N-terminal cleavage/methylation domain-containing protein
MELAMWTSAKTHDPKRQKQAGFTILELMIATMVFSVILLVVSAGILSFTKQYVKGITTSNTQAVARAVMADVVQNIQFSGSSPQPPNTTVSPTQQCIGNVVYYYELGQQVTPTQHSLVKDIGSCAVGGIGNFVSLSPTQHEMLAPGMRIAEFSVVPVGENGANVTITVTSGDEDLFIDSSGRTSTDPAFDWSSVHCRTGSGSQFCGISHLATFVQARIGS